MFSLLGASLREDLRATAAATGERAHHEHTDDVETVHHPEGGCGRGGSKTSIDGIRNKMRRQNRCREATRRELGETVYVARDVILQSPHTIPLYALVPSEHL